MTRNGSAYVARNNSIGIDPQLPGAAWTLFASGGEIGPAGANGTDGTNGANGANGTNGTNGTDGINGANGANGLSAVVINIAPSPSGPCAAGGAEVRGGDGFSVPVCNGQNRYNRSGRHVGVVHKLFPSYTFITSTV